MVDGIAASLASANQITLQTAVLDALRAFNADMQREAASAKTSEPLGNLRKALTVAHGANFEVHGTDCVEAETAMAHLECRAADQLGTNDCQAALASRSEISSFVKSTPSRHAKQAILYDAHDLVNALNVFNKSITDDGDMTLGDKRVGLLSVLEVACSKSKKHATLGPCSAACTFVSVVASAQEEAETSAKSVRKHIHVTSLAKLREMTASLREVAQCAPGATR
jgi:hypothetical protein